MSVLSMRLIDGAGTLLCTLACLAGPGCRWLTEGGFSSPLRLPGESQTAAGKSSQADAAAPRSTDSPEDRAVLARSVEKDALGHPHSVWIRTVDPLAKYRWWYPNLDELLARPAERRPALRRYLADKDPVVATNAAIALAEAGDGHGAERLVTAVSSPQLPSPTRCAAVEALAALPAEASVAPLRTLLDQYGRAAPGNKSRYIAELHAELLRGLARQVDAADDPHFTEALRSPAADVRLEALAAWTASRRGELPVELCDLRTNGDARVRAAAVEALAKHHHPQAQQYALAALNDTEIQVRTSAIAVLGELGGADAQTTLQGLLEKQQPEMIRAEAVSALARLGAKKAVLDAAGDKSWRVRVKVATSLAAWPDREGVNAAERLLDDPSGQVERATVAALADWPLEKAGPLLLAAMAKSVVATRKAAAEQLASRWPAAVEFSFDAPPDRRTEVLGGLQKRFRQEFAEKRGQDYSADGTLKDSRAFSPLNSPDLSSPSQITPAEIDRAEQLIRQRDVPSLLKFGPGLLATCERLVFDRQQALPDVVYRAVLPHYGEAFAALNDLTSTDVSQRRRAADRLTALANDQPLSRLAVNRLDQLTAAEPDQLVWRSVLMAVAADPSEAAMRLAYAAIGHASPEIRRRACEHLAAHPDPKHAKVLLPALDDASQPVVCAAIRALGRCGRLDDAGPLRRLAASPNEQVQLETAVALVRLGDPSGNAALDRMTYSSDPMIQRQAAQAMGELGDAAFTPALIRLLDGHVSVCRAALESLPKTAGRDIAPANGQPPENTSERIRRWKQWSPQDAVGSRP